MRKFPTPASFASARELADHVGRLGVSLAIDDEVVADGPLALPLTLAGRTLGNRFAVQPMEGWDAHTDGTPSADTLRRWRRFGRSGAKLIWGGEAFAVTADGRANPHQLYFNRELPIDAALRALRAEVLAGHAEVGQSADDLLIGLQLTHSGRQAWPTAAGRQPQIAYRHALLDARVGVEDDRCVLSDAQLEAIADSFVAAAGAAAQAGFDFVDVKCCHGYLLHELLSAHERGGAYGGSFANRTRLLRRIIANIRTAHPGLQIGVRISIADVFPYRAGPDGIGAPIGVDDHIPYRLAFGVDPDQPTRFALDEPLQLLRMLHDLDIRLINVTLGSPYVCPHLQRPAAYPPSDGYLPPADPLLGVAAHLELTAACKRACPDLVIVGSGYSYLQEYLPHVAQAQVRGGHVDSVGLGRSMLAYPELPLDVLAGRPLDRKRLCRTFSDCTSAPRNGLKSGCYPLDPHYRQTDAAAIVRRLRRTNR